ncbi:MAG: alpha/beta fold hydrolase [Anaerolineales bacterium]|jgi:phospholipase/carboxylesterase
MPTETEPQLLTYQNWTFRYRPGRENFGHLLVLLHGLSGDETSMWFFTRSLPPGGALLAPRAPFPAPEAGYSWREFGSANKELPSLEQLRPSVDSLLAFLDGWSASAHVQTEVIHLMGFSQGAAMTYAFALLHPERVHAIAALSGFLLAGAEPLLEQRRLDGKPVFVSHGSQDEMVPVELARRAVSFLKASGASVTYCEAETGHKVSSDCLKGVESFFRSIYNQPVTPD